MDGEMNLELLTPAELALRLKVSERTVMRLAGVTIPAKRVMGKTRFYWPDVVASLPAAPSPVAVVPTHPTFDAMGHLTRYAEVLRRGGR